MKMEWKRRISKLLIMAMAVTMACTGYGRNVPELQAAGAAPRAAASGISVTKHSKEEIRSYLQAHPINLKQFGNPVTYAEEPVVSAPYSPGRISEDTRERALTTLNAIRYIAGLSDDVISDEEYEKKVQAGALVNYVNKKLSHTPTQPDDMDEALYKLGYSGTSSANIAWASWAVSLEYTLVHSWMADEDNSNIDCVGHRRWVLNPTMGKTAFGAVSGSNGTYSAMYSFDRSKAASQYGVCWPAQTMPLEFFDDEYPWSISMGKSVDVSKAFVTVTRERDGQKWYFSSSLADGAFYVNNDSYGQTGCIIFRPNDIHYEDGDVFEVEIGGLSEPVSYEVEFFASAESTPSPSPTSSPTLRPSRKPSATPLSTSSPTLRPSREPSATPLSTSSPTLRPSRKPSATPLSTSSPTLRPSGKPGDEPDQKPTLRPSGQPSEKPDASPSASPEGTSEPTQAPEESPSAMPENTDEPTQAPAESPGVSPEGTGQPSSPPTQNPSVLPTRSPVPVQPTISPTGTNMALGKPQSSATSESGQGNTSAGVSQVVAKPAKAVIRSLKNSKTCKVQVEMKRQQGVSGYQVQYATKKNMASAKKITAKSNRVTLKKLQAKRIYYVRARVYRVQNGKRVYGSWSSKKRIKVTR